MDNHIVIMAGGIGSRFWPMSTPECPKQFIDVMGCGRTLIQLTADRFDGVCPRENVWVVTSEKYIDIVREQLPEIPESNILAEPCARNTAPCIAYACWKIKKKHPNANVVVLSLIHILPGPFCPQTPRLSSRPRTPDTVPASAASRCRIRGTQIPS